MAGTRQGRTERRDQLLVFLILLLVVISVVPWRRGTIYSGGADPVVVAKAIVGIIAFCCAFALHWVTKRTGSVGVRTLSLLAGIVLISAMGALAAGDATAALVLSVRIVLIAATVVIVVKSAPPLVVLNALLAALGVIALVSGATGALQGLTGGRLSGGIPEMAPNVLAGLAAPPAIGLAADIARRGFHLLNTAAIIAMLAIVFATQSRTTLLVAVIGIVLTLFLSRRIARSTAIVTIATVPVLYVLLTFTDTVVQIFARGQGLDQLTTLSSRTVAWDAVLATPVDSWAKWIGIGLAAKTVPVQQPWRIEQVLDSSWVSVIAQAGVIGTVLLVIWIVVTSVESLRRPGMRAVMIPLLVMLLIRSFTESGLIDSSATFLLFLTISLILEPGTMFPGRPKPEHPYQLAAPLPIEAQRTLV
ncbi:MAG: hypothetical protein JWN09_1971 [Microbacteriaceae bacterium]|nr:hypothetical protein [Microbacteriaceae bacterium]